MALFYECMPKCARKLVDTADIVRDAILRQQSFGAADRAEDRSHAVRLSSLLHKPQARQKSRR